MTSESRPAVFYDGACPVCRREIAHYQGSAGAENLVWVDATTCAAEAFGPDLTREAALARVHVRAPDGSLASGAAAFALMWQALPRWRWLGRIVGSRPVLPLAEAGYRLFLRLRRTWR